MLSTRKPSGISWRSGLAPPRERRKNDWLPHAATYSVLPSGDIASPLAPDASLPGTLCHPLAVCHSQSSPFTSPFCSAAICRLRGRKLEAMNPPSGSARTELTVSYTHLRAHETP